MVEGPRRDVVEPGAVERAPHRDEDVALLPPRHARGGRGTVAGREALVLRRDRDERHALLAQREDAPREVARVDLRAGRVEAPVAAPAVRLHPRGDAPHRGVEAKRRIDLAGAAQEREEAAVAVTRDGEASEVPVPDALRRVVVGEEVGRRLPVGRAERHAHAAPPGALLRIEERAQGGVEGVRRQTPQRREVRPREDAPESEQRLVAVVRIDDDRPRVRRVPGPRHRHRLAGEERPPGLGERDGRQDRVGGNRSHVGHGAGPARGAQCARAAGRTAR